MLSARHYLPDMFAARPGRPGMAAPSKAEFLRRQRTFHAGHRGVTDPLFAHSDFFDPRDLLVVKCEMLRRVRVDGWPIARAAGGFVLSRDACYEALRRWEHRGLLGLVPEFPGPRGAHKLTPDVLDFLGRYALEKGPASGVSLAGRLWRERGVRLYPRTIEKALAGCKKGVPSGRPATRSRPIGPAATRHCAMPGWAAGSPARSASCSAGGCSPGCAPVPSIPACPRPRRWRRGHRTVWSPRPRRTRG
jgi:hypothetical protein